MLQPAPERSQSDSDEGPASKQPRLSLSHSHHSDDGRQQRRQEQAAPAVPAASLMDTTQPPQQPRNMVGASAGIKVGPAKCFKQPRKARDKSCGASITLASFVISQIDT